MWMQRSREHTPGAKAPIFARFERTKAEALVYLEARAHTCLEARAHTYLEAIAQTCLE
jgi:hypothetical protein